jgi:CDP-diacylglycerol--serine O-phosphatidyltransferase
MITLLNLLSGCVAAFFVFRGDLQTAFILVCIAAVFDFLDGLAARLLKQYSPLGVQLDSLADMVSFGFVPAAVMLQMYQGSGGMGPMAWLTFLLAAFSALRLAKFNIDDQQTDEFIGLPTPACALLVGSLGYLQASAVLSVEAWWVLAATGVLCFLLVSPIRMFSLKFKTWDFKRNALRYSFLAASLAAIGVLGVGGVAVAIVGYVVTSIVRNTVLAFS